MIFAVLACCALIMIRYERATAQPVAFFISQNSPLIVNFGEVCTNSTVLKDIIICNDFGKNIDVASLNAACGCITAGINKQHLNRGERTVLHLRFHLGSFNGRQTHRLFVVNDDLSRAEIILQAVVVEAIEAKPYILVWHTHAKPNLQYICVRSKVGRIVRLDDVVTSDTNIALSIVPKFDYYTETIGVMPLRVEGVSTATLTWNVLLANGAHIPVRAYVIIE